uniref:Late blight resistance protein, putative n=1 Tax=Solanum demissum TaxID=50514 RepID=Q6L3M3_SOLDE|nr:Late blight resistance protein, putative [Solanum demissum]
MAEFTRAQHFVTACHACLVCPQPIELHQHDPHLYPQLTTDSGVLSWINDVQDADPGYLNLHHQTMQANWHQYMECTSMRAGKLSNKG